MEQREGFGITIPLPPGRPTDAYMNMTSPSGVHVDVGKDPPAGGGQYALYELDIDANTGAIVSGPTVQGSQSGERHIRGPQR